MPPSSKHSWIKASALLLLLAAPAAAQDSQGTAPTPKPHAVVPRPIAREPHAVKPPAEVDDAIETFFKSIEASEVRKAYQTLLAGTRLISRDEDLTGFITQTQHAMEVYGQMTDFEVYDTRMVGSRLLVTTYLTFQPVAPMRWRFIYYRADKKWTLINIVFDDSMADLVE